MEIFAYIIEQARYLSHKTASVEDAEDIIQDVFEIVWRKKKYFEDKPLEQQKKIVSYVIRNAWYDTLRARKAKRRTPDGPPPTDMTEYKPTVYSLLELKYVMEKIDEHNLKCLLDVALGYSADEAIKRNKKGNRINLHSTVCKQRKKLQRLLEI